MDSTKEVTKNSLTNRKQKLFFTEKIQAWE